MDKSVEMKFTSEYWREVNEQYFSVDKQVSIDDYVCNYKSTILLPTYASMACGQLIQKILEPYLTGCCSVANLNAANLKQRLCIMQQERELHVDPIQNMMDELIDNVCIEEMQSTLQSAQLAIEGMSQMSEVEQMGMLKNEQQLLMRLHKQVISDDELSQIIEQLYEDMSKLQADNRQNIERLFEHVDEVNTSQQYKYEIEYNGQMLFKLRRVRLISNRMREEQEYLKLMIIMNQDAQIADGIAKAAFNIETNMMTLTLDRYIMQGNMEVSLDQFTNMQKLREIPYELQDATGRRSDDVIDMQFCHYCRLQVDSRNLKQCQYNHVDMKLHEFSDEILTEQRYKISNSNMNEFLLDLYSSNYVLESNRIQCKRYFCNICLKYELNSHSEYSSEWVCPLCKGECNCSRCVRADQILKLKRSYLELGGSFEKLYAESKFEQLVEDKRQYLRNMKLDIPAMLRPQLEVEAEKTLPVKKNATGTKKYNTVNTTHIFIKKKKKSYANQLIPKIHKLSHIESSSSSQKFRRSKEINGLVGNDYPVEFFLQ